jgi:hypothetical protein
MISGPRLLFVSLKARFLFRLFRPAKPFSCSADIFYALGLKCLLSELTGRVVRAACVCDDEFVLVAHALIRFCATHAGIGDTAFDFLTRFGDA